MDKKLYVLFSFCILILAGCNDLNNTITQETKYNVFYNGNGNTSGSVPYDNNLYLPGSEAIVLDKGTLQRNGFSFVNWNTNQHGNGNTYNVGEKLIIGSNSITLYAVWNELGKYIVTFETFGGSAVNELVNVVHGSKLTKPTNPTKANSAFEGWYIDEEFETEWDFQNNLVENNITLYAKWRSNLYPYEVTNISGYKVGIYLMIYWTNPTDENFSHVRVILSGFEWAESMGGTDQDPGKTSYSAADFAGTEYVIIKCVGKDGNVSEGMKYYFSDTANPVSSDFNINGLGTYHYDGTAKTVSITPKSGSSQGEITVYYNGSTTLPIEVGTYTVTFDVAAKTGFNAATGLSAGTIIINIPQDPIENDFNISGLGTYYYNGISKMVTIIPKSGSSQGTITIYYNGLTVAPIMVGTYTVTFDIAAATGFNAVEGLSAGIIIINSANPVASDFNISGLGTYHYDGIAKTVIITPKENNSQGTIIAYYNGIPTSPVIEGTYTVTFDVAPITGFNAAIGLTAGTITITPPYTVNFNSNGGSNVDSIIRVTYGNKIIEPTTPTKNGFLFINWYKNASLTNVWDFANDTVTNDTTLYAKWDFQYTLGSTGPGGGKIFYRSEAGFIMADTGERCYYLEVAPTSVGTLAWASSGYTYTAISSAVANSIGRGRNNTSNILAVDINAPAAKACINYSNGGKTDWFLPSYDELNQLYINSTSVNIARSSEYWSSSQTTNGDYIVWAKDFSNGNQIGAVKSDTRTVRPIRAF